MKNTLPFVFLFGSITAFSQNDQILQQNNIESVHLVTKRVLVEEMTGTSCGFCVAGAVRLSEMNKKYPSTAALVSIHCYNDPMQDEVYKMGAGNILAGGPSSMVDRQFANYAQTDVDSMETMYLRRIKYTPVIDVFIDKVSYNHSSRLLSFNVNAATVAPFNGSYRFNAVITEMRVHGTTADYDQNNDYAGGAAGPMGGYENLPNPVPAADMYYDFVGRTILGGWAGTANSIPATNASGQTLSYTYTKTIPAEWDDKNLSLIGFVINSTDGSVENASLPVQLNSIATGMDAAAKTQLIAYPNPTTGLVSVRDAGAMDITAFDVTGSQIVKTTKNTTQIDLSDLSNGVYFLKFTNEKESFTKKIILIK